MHARHGRGATEGDRGQEAAGIVLADAQDQAPGFRNGSGREPVHTARPSEGFTGELRCNGSGPLFSRVLSFPGLKPGKDKTREKRGIHIGLLAQGGAPLALGYYHVVPTGLVFGSLLSHKGQTDNVQLSSRPQLSGRTRNPAPGEQLKLPSDDQLYKEAVGAVRKAKTNSKVELPLG